MTEPAQRATITGLILTLNGERLLDRCLSSLDFCDRLLIIDSGSTDATPEIAARHKADFIHNAWQGPKAQFEFGVRQVTTDYVFTLDQDEVCSTRLKHSILDVLANAAKGSALPAYYVPRRSWYFNRFLKHSGWYPDWLLRLFRPAAAEFHQSGAHESIHPALIKGRPAPTGRLSGDILHYPYESFTHHLAKVNAYAEEGALDMRAKGRRGGILPGLIHAASRFLKVYFFKLGLLDGRAGFINAAHASFYAFLKYVRIEESAWGAPFTDDELPTGQSGPDKE